MFFRALIRLPLVVVATFGLFVLSKAEPLNVVIVTADDLGLQIGSYGDPLARTPNLDRFADEGVRFSHAYVTQSSCSPSRSSMLTGLYPHQNGHIGLANRGYAMHEKFPTLPHLMQAAGFETGIIGKLHVEPASAFPFSYDARAGHDTVTRSRQSIRDRLSEFLDSTKDRRFFLMVNYFDPHLPLRAQVDGLPKQPRTAEDFQGWYFQGGLDFPAQRQRISDYYNSVERLDALFGDLLQELEDRGLAMNTLILFMSDNGPPFSRAKMAEYDASVHVPLIIRWPGVSRSGTVASALVSGVDVFATALDAAGIINAPSKSGRSLRSITEGRMPADWRGVVATEFNAHSPKAFYPRRSITDGRYRLIRNLLAGTANPMPRADGDTATMIASERHGKDAVVDSIFERHSNPPPIELYDVQSDPGCLYDLSQDHTHVAIRNRLQNALAAWMSETDDPLRDAEKLKQYRLLHEANGSGNWVQTLPR